MRGGFLGREVMRQGKNIKFENLYFAWEIPLSEGG